MNKYTKYEGLYAFLRFLPEHKRKHFINEMIYNEGLQNRDPLQILILMEDRGLLW